MRRFLTIFLLLLSVSMWADAVKWENYEFSFRARVPEDAEQVQLWAGFRNHNRFDRYMVGIKGGLQDDVYLMRTGYMGTDEFMGVRPLGFHPVPGEWYELKVQVCRNRIRVFVGDSVLPHIDVIDRNGHLVPSGPVSLDEGWIDAEYDGLDVRPLAEDALDEVPRTELRLGLTADEKAAKRVSERAGYSPVIVNSLKGSRTEVSLDGDWLFAPEYEVGDKTVAVSASSDDSSWHVMQVPSFWNPIRIWLHGETMPAANGQEHKGVSDTYYQKETDRCENYTFDYRRTGAAWYRQWVDLPSSVEGRRMVLGFDAVSKTAEVYVNGTLAGTHVGMFGDFEVDVTEYMRPGRNLVAVKVVRDIKGAAAQMSDAMENYYSSVRKDIDSNKGDAQAHKSVLTDIPHGFYGDNPAGIWQPVKLVISDPLKMEDVFIKPRLDGAAFELTVNNADSRRRNFKVGLDIVDKADGSLLYSSDVLSSRKLQAGQSQTLTFDVSGLSPKLWEPSSPALYDFRFTLIEKGNVTDSVTVVSGFRTFESKDGHLFLNGRKYWLRGGNHIPFAICPNDMELADRFMQLMQEGNVNATRTHTSPWNELWVSAADRNGIIVSFEGTWSWLMIHSTPIPTPETLELWRSEWLQVMKKYRNHPSVCLWTVNNEMKFYDLDEDLERAKEKFIIISDVVRQMRVLDPTRPISFDSNYMRRSGVRRFGEEFIATVDDGDIDDNHGYYNWYDFSLFRFFNGEFYRDFGTPGRPLISQEMSTGYPNNETGHPTRSYQLIHQNPYSLIGYEAYDWADPSSFLTVQSFITGELAEALRRTGDNVSGIMHFSYMTWFRQCYDAESIEPYPTYYAMKRAMQPILVSAEIWGRNLYAGDRLNTRVYVVNDSEDGRDLGPTQLEWTLEDLSGNVIARGKEDVPAVKYYGRVYVEPEVRIPSDLPCGKMKAVFRVKLHEGGEKVSENEYSLLLARKEWISSDVVSDRKIALMDQDGMASVFESVGLEYSECRTIDVALDSGADVVVLSGVSSLDEGQVSRIRAYQSAGGRLLLLNSNDAVMSLYPEYVTGWFVPTEGDIVVMERKEHPVFDGIGPLELRYFNNGRREIPLACRSVLKAVRHENVKELASQMKIHAYIDGGRPEDRIERIESMRGLVLMQITYGEGTALVSTLCTEKAASDPVAGKILMNLLTL